MGCLMECLRERKIKEWKVLFIKLRQIAMSIINSEILKPEWQMRVHSDEGSAFCQEVVSAVAIDWKDHK